MEQVISKNCYKCKETLGENSDWCASCGSPQTTECRGCKTVFHKKHIHCPDCGTSRYQRMTRERPRHSSPMKAYQEAGQEFLIRHKLYLLYIAMGIFAGTFTRPALIWLASFSMPADWLKKREAAPFSWGHFFEPFYGAMKTLAMWAVMGPQYAVLKFYDFFLDHPSAVVLGLFGAGLGFFMAYQKERRRRRHRRRRSSQA